MRTEDLEEVVATDLADGGGVHPRAEREPDDDSVTWEQYVDDMWEDRAEMFDSFPSDLSFISWRALVRKVANDLGLVS